MNRHKYAANVLNAIIMQLQQCCAGCKLPFAGLTALQMQAVDFAHQEKKSPKCSKDTSHCAHGSDFEFTFAEYRKCESKCKFCHVLEGETRGQRQERLENFGSPCAATTQPQHVPMKDVLTRERCAKLEAFFKEARFSGLVPKKSFGELRKFAQEMGVNPASVIAFDEEKWNTPSPDNKQGDTGMNRNQLAANMLNAIIMQLQQCC